LVSMKPETACPATPSKGFNNNCNTGLSSPACHLVHDEQNNDADNARFYPIFHGPIAPFLQVSPKIFNEFHISS